MEASYAPEQILCFFSHVVTQALPQEFFDQEEAPRFHLLLPSEVHTKPDFMNGFQCLL
jgi:hypothetical protein